jgi:hypothetical protein
MRGSVRTVITFLVALGVVLGLGARAEAQQVLTFDEMRPNPLQSPILGSIECANPTGVRFYSDHFHVIGPDYLTDFSSSGSTHLGFESGRGFPVTMERVGAGTFSLFSLDVAEFYSAPVANYPDAEWLTLTGYQEGGGVVTHNIPLDGIRDGVGGVADFEHVVLPNTFVNLRSVVFTGWRQGNLAGGIAFDNLEYAFNQPETIPACSWVALPSDTPTVSFISPAAGEVSGIVAIQAQATDNVGVVGVVFKLDGVELGPVDPDSPYTLAWDSTAVPDGPYTLTAEARDAANNVGTVSMVITVHNHTVLGGPYYLQFDGVDDHVLVADAPALSFGNGTTDRPFTMELWMRPEAITKHQLIGKWGDSSNQEYRLQIAQGTIRLDLRDESTGGMASAFTIGGASLLGGWHHLAVTYDGRGGATAADGIAVYLDGVAVALARINDPAYVAMENLASPVEIGREGPSWNQFAGGLDEIRLWSMARTASEIQTWMTGELGGVQTGLVAYWRFNEGTGFLVSDDSDGNATGALINGPVWVAGGPLAPDTTAPAIANVAVSNLTATSAAISFTTNEPATGVVSYATTASCPCTEVSGGAAATSHAIALSGLTPDTVYHFQVRATDGAGNVQTTATLTFHTLVLSTDTEQPTVSITSPVSGPVAGVIAVVATASDNVGVTSVQFRVDGTALGAPLTAAPYTVTLDTTTLSEGAHTLTAEARDAANNVRTASVAVVVDNVIESTGPHYLAFDGVDDYVQVADAPALSFGNGTADRPFTMELWMRPTAVTKHQLIGKWDEALNQEYRLQIAQGTLRVDLRDQSANALATVFGASLPSALLGEWHHLAVTYDGRGGATAADGIAMYLDGVAVALVRINDPAYVAMENLAAPVEIGREGPSWVQFAGGLDEIRLWSVARTAAEIQGAMLGELSGVESGLVAYWRLNEGAGGSSADDSPATNTAVLHVGVAWAAGGPLVPDTTAPAIANVAVSNLSASGATITFTTDEPATGVVLYTATASCPCTEVAGGAATTSHTIALSGLTGDTEYRFQMRATDAASNQQTTATLTFHTLVPSTDTEQPTVSITSPVAGTVAGVIAVVAAASDNVGVTSVQFRVDGTALGAPLTAAPYSVMLDTTTLSEGAHSLTAEARDAANNVRTASVAVVVDNVIESTGPHYLAFDGVDDYVQVADAPALSFGNGTADTPFTMELWLRPDAVTKHQLMGKWGESSNQEYRLQIAQGTIRLDLRDQSTGGMAYAFTNGGGSLLGGWHHLAVTYDGRGGATAADGIAMYLDGVAVALVRINDPAYVAMENLAAPVEIGREGPFWNQFAGGLDEIRVWNVARTAAEIQGAMLDELSGVESGLVAYWRLNEGAGGSSADDSPATNTAVLHAGVAWVAGGPLHEQ